MKKLRQLSRAHDLTDDDKAALAVLLREAIERDRFPLSPRVRSFKAILAKLDQVTGYRDAAGAGAAGPAQHGADEEAAQIKQQPFRCHRVG